VLGRQDLQTAAWGRQVEGDLLAKQLRRERGGFEGVPSPAMPLDSCRCLSQPAGSTLAGKAGSVGRGAKATGGGGWPEQRP
jgi:hypothetical protein